MPKNKNLDSVKLQVQGFRVGERSLGDILMENRKGCLKAYPVGRPNDRTVHVDQNQFKIVVLML